jgi:hypothetical protein
VKFQQHESPLACPKAHRMLWLGSVYWLCSKCKTIFVEEWK